MTHRAVTDQLDGQGVQDPLPVQVDSEGLLPARNRFLSHRIRETLLVGAFVAMVILFATQRADIFLSSQNVYNLINGIPVFGLLAIGVTVVLTLGEFDLSVTSVASLSSIIVAVLVTQGGLDLGFGLALSVIIALAAGAFLGAVSGVAVGYFGANAFIVTLAVGSVASGFELLIQGKISGGQTSIALANLPRTLLKLSSDHLFGFEVAVPIFLVIAIVIGLILALTPWGRHVQAIGGNETAARVAGVAVRRTKLVAFTLTGVLAAFAGVFFVARNGYYSNSMPQYLLEAYAAAFFGAAAVGRRGFSVPATLFGVLFLSTLSNGLLVLNDPLWVSTMAQGVVLLVAVVIARVGAPT